MDRSLQYCRSYGRISFFLLVVKSELWGLQANVKHGKVTMEAKAEQNYLFFFGILDIKSIANYVNQISNVVVVE